MVHQDRRALAAMRGDERMQPLLPEALRGLVARIQDPVGVQEHTGARAERLDAAGARPPPPPPRARAAAPLPSRRAARRRPAAAAVDARRSPTPASRPPACAPRRPP